MGESKRELAIRMLKENDCMLNSCLNEDELKHFKNYDFIQYLINCLSIPNRKFDNCHNATCKEKCRKDGYNKAINDFVEKYKFCDNRSIQCHRALNCADCIAEQLKGGDCDI